MMEEAIGFVVGLVAIVAVVMIVAAGISAPVLLLERGSCHSQARAMGLVSSWGPLQDCMVEVDGRLLPLNTYLSRTVPQAVEVRP